MDSKAAGRTKLRDRIDFYCRIWPESTFYFRQLLGYINNGPRETPHSLRTFEHTKTQDTPAITSLAEKSVPFHPDDTAESPSLFIVEGNLCPEDIIELALHCNLRLEFFLGHLEIERVLNVSRTSYELPALPSRRGNIVHVRLVTLWRSSDPGRLHPVNIEPSERAKADIICREYEHQLLDRRQPGATRFRKVHLHNSKHFTVEQMVSFCAVPIEHGKETNWRLIYLIDSGQPLTGTETYPWNGPLGQPGFCPTLLHAVQYNERYTSSTSVRLQVDPPPDFFKMHPYHPLKDFEPECRSNLLKRPFFGLASVLAASARSWNQILNFIEDDVAMHQDAPNNQASAALTQIRFNAGVIQRFQGFIQEGFDTVQNGVWNNVSTVGPTQKSSPQDEDLDKEQDVTSQELLQDYDGLLARCRLLSQRCDSATSLLQSSMALLESQKSIQQTEEVNKLTKLATIFVPLSLVSSIFGMNVSEISPETVPKVWHFVLTSVVVLVPCLYLSFGLPEKLRLHWLRRNSNSFQVVESVQQIPP